MGWALSLEEAADEALGEVPRQTLVGGVDVLAVGAHVSR